MATSEELSKMQEALEKVNETDKRYLDLLQACEKQIETARAANRKLRISVPPGFTPPSKWEGIDPLCTDRAKAMSWYFNMFGVIGLADYIAEIAKYEARDEAERKRKRDAFSQSQTQDENEMDEASHSDTSVTNYSSCREELDEQSPGKYDKSWDLILDDQKNGSKRILYYLSSLPAELIHALIEGSLPSRMQDTTFRRRVESFVTPKDRQGTYGIWIAAQRKAVQSTQDDVAVNANVGKGMTLKQMMKVHEIMSTYINTKDPNSRELAKRIDTTYSGSEKQIARLDYKYQRRYSSGGCSDDFSHQKGWLDFIELHYIRWAKEQLDTADEHLLDIPMQRCPVYVGLSRSVSGRMPNHWKHTATSNPTIGLLTATLEHLYPGSFSVAGSSYQIFRTVSKADIGLDEKLSMLLTGAYPWDGGLNAAYAGRSKGKVDESLQSYRRLEASKLEIQAEGLVKVNLEGCKQTLQKLDEMLKMRDENQSHNNKLIADGLRHIEDIKSKREELASLRVRMTHARVVETIARHNAAKEAQKKREDER